MKEIGEKLKEAREEIGVSIEEAAEDLKLRPSQIEDIEQGNMEAFEDIFFLKYFMRDYSKYLGLDSEAIVDEFNEYLFDYTSKISLSDIKKAQSELKDNKKEEDKISSPYTKDTDKKKSLLVIIIISIILILVVIGIVIFKMNNKDKATNDNKIIYKELIEGVY